MVLDLAQYRLGLPLMVLDCFPHQAQMAQYQAQLAAQQQAASVVPLAPKGSNTAPNMLGGMFGGSDGGGGGGGSGGSAGAAAAAKLPRHPHFLVPQHLLLADDGVTQLAAFEYCPHSLSSLARAGVVRALSLAVCVQAYCARWPKRWPSARSCCKCTCSASCAPWWPCCRRVT